MRKLFFTSLGVIENLGAARQLSAHPPFLYREPLAGEKKPTPPAPFPGKNLCRCSTLLGEGRESWEGGEGVHLPFVNQRKFFSSVHCSVSPHPQSQREPLAAPPSLCRRSSRLARAAIAASVGLAIVGWSGIGAVAASLARSGGQIWEKAIEKPLDSADKCFSLSTGVRAKVGCSPGAMRRDRVGKSAIAQAASETTLSRLVAANTRFGFKLFSAIRQQDANKNIFISPASVAIALAVTYNGAKGSTEQAIANTLELQGMSLSELNQGNAALTSTFASLDRKVQLAIANSLWGKPGEPFQPDFIQRAVNFYGARVSNVDFGDSNTLEIVNGWVRQSTNGKIDKILHREDINSSTVAVLLDAIYFRGAWTLPFLKAKTQNRPFHLLSGDRKQHPMMFQEAQYVSYYQNEIFQAVALPYGEGRLSMYIFLPKPDVSLKTFYETLTAENWQQWIDQFYIEERGVFVGLPRFKIEYEVDLVNPLKSLGMESAFNPGADFTGMSVRGFEITKVKHKTFLDVNEEGTEAAGVTAVTVSRGGKPDISMIVDRPFFCAIQDSETGLILFMGAIVEPE